MKKLFLITLILTTSYYILITSALAASTFSTSYDFNYRVSESGITSVTQEISITNLTSNYYASDYSLNFPTDKIKNVSAFSESGPLPAGVTYPEGATRIEVKFEDKNKVVGVGKTLNWTLSYDSSGIASQKGRVWEIKIPRADINDQTVSYRVNLSFPQSFGKPSYISPKPLKDYFWTEKEGAKNGITLSFGNWQAYEFTSVYNLKNSSYLPKFMELTLPPSTVSQQISLTGQTPKPLWKKQYFLWPRQTLSVKVTGYAKVLSYPFEITGLPAESQFTYATQP